MKTVTKDMRKIIHISKILIIDYFAVTVAAFLALWIRYDFLFSSIPLQYVETLLHQAFIFSGITVIMLFVFRLYASIWQFVGVHDLIHIVLATAIAEILIFIIGYIFKATMPIAFYILEFLLALCFIATLRFSYRVISLMSSGKQKKREYHERVMLVGAGRMGTTMIEELVNENYKFGKPVILIDDDREKKGKRIRGIKIAGNSEDIPRLAKSGLIDKIIFCIPSATLETKRKILNIALKTGCQIKVAQSIRGSLKSSTESKNIRDVDVADLLTRPAVDQDKALFNYLQDQVVLVTGGGGSIGSELCRRIAKYGPKKLIIFEIYENNAYDLVCELKEIYGDTIDIQIRIGSVREIARLDQVFSEFRPSIVFHAAAHKHVPILEDSPMEAIKNNVFGTLNTAKVASKHGVSRFVLLSTDKAVNPTSVMGASKRITEMIIQAVNWHNKTIFAAVRFGNVLGSNGSVIPLFKKQIAKGGPVTVTHPDITRYFMTIPEAAQLVVQSGGFALGGEVFFLDMGEQIKIYDLAVHLIKLSGLEPNEDIKIEFTGLRPGEKLYEELSYPEEERNRKTTSNSKILITPPIDFDTKVFRIQLDKLKELAAEENVEELHQTLKEIIYDCVDHSETKTKNLA